MTFRVHAPPIKSQGIKTKLVSWIHHIVPEYFDGVWIEPFMGTGAVAFNIQPKKAILCDTNPHIIRFYSALATNEITPLVVRNHLIHEGDLLSTKGEDYYYLVRDRFNQHQNPLDFLFLNRACFNGMMRFNRKGAFNVPFCRKPERFSQSYITKITNQVNWVHRVLKTGEYVFKCQDFKQTLSEAGANDLVYCDPPYIDRHVDYYNGWNDSDEHNLFAMLTESSANFILSTWHHNNYRKNQYIQTLWSKHHILTKSHFYHVGGKEINRNEMIEALVTNFGEEFSSQCVLNTRKEKAVNIGQQVPLFA